MQKDLNQLIPRCHMKKAVLLVIKLNAAETLEHSASVKGYEQNTSSLRLGLIKTTF